MKGLSTIALLLLMSLALPACASGGKSDSPVQYTREIRRDPNLAVHVVKVDLSDPRVSVRVSAGGPDPDGKDGKWLTTLLPVPEVAERDGYDIAINGGFFGAQNTKDIEGKNTGYVRGKWAMPNGPSVTDGKLWAPAATTRPALLVDPQRRAAIAEIDPKLTFPSDVQQAIGGNVLLLKDGKKVAHKDPKRYPRTVIGLDKANTTLIILTVDGYHAKYSIGMSYAELSDKMMELGAYTAVNLDGGGSTTLVMRDGKTRKLWVMNRPSDGKPRSVADSLGIKIRGGLASTRPSPN